MKTGKLQASVYLILLATLGPVVYSAFVQKLIPEAEEKFLESRA
jgi:hypothetical protein